jgi:nucleoside-diphosphate-sugar epimerase
MSRILVTGASGFCGRHLVHRLLERGDEVWAVDSLAPLTGGKHPDDWDFDVWDYPLFRWYKEDCRKWFRLRPHLELDYAFHLAAIVGGREMIENNPLAVADDLSIDAAYWQWAVKAKPGKSVIFSSSAAYPIYMQSESYWNAFHHLMYERDLDFTLRGGIGIGFPDMAYGWAKATCEYLARLAYQKHGLKSICFRPFSGYGEDQDDAYPFPSIMKRVLAGNSNAYPTSTTIKVWGTGKQMRDFIYIEDVIDGVLTMMDKIDDGDAVNLSTGIYTSFIELAQLAADVVPYTYRPAVEGMSDKPTGVFARAGDTAKQERLGFRAKTTLREGIRLFMEEHGRVQHVGRV